LRGAQAELKRLRQSLQEAQQLQKSLTAEKDTLTQQLSGARDQAKVIAAARENLTRELDSAKKTGEEARARAVERNTAYEQLQKKHSQLESTNAASQAELKKTHQLQQDTQQKLQAANTEKDSLAQKLQVANTEKD
jgi:chromosome segregation ATPase